MDKSLHKYLTGSYTHGLLVRGIEIESHIEEIAFIYAWVYYDVTIGRAMYYGTKTFFQRPTKVISGSFGAEFNNFLNFVLTSYFIQIALELLECMICAWQTWSCFSSNAGTDHLPIDPARQQICSGCNANGI